MSTFNAKLHPRDRNGKFRSRGARSAKIRKAGAITAGATVGGILGSVGGISGATAGAISGGRLGAHIVASRRQAKKVRR